MTLHCIATRYGVPPHVYFGFAPASLDAFLIDREVLEMGLSNEKREADRARRRNARRR